MLGSSYRLCIHGGTSVCVERNCTTIKGRRTRYMMTQNVKKTEKSVAGNRRNVCESKETLHTTSCDRSTQNANIVRLHCPTQVEQCALF